MGTKNKPKTLIQRNPLYKPGSGGSPSALTALGDGIVKRKDQREATNHVRIMTCMQVWNQRNPQLTQREEGKQKTRVHKQKKHISGNRCIVYCHCFFSLFAFASP